jgi:hypothetical protein
VGKHYFGDDSRRSPVGKHYFCDDLCDVSSRLGRRRLRGLPTPWVVRPFFEKQSDFVRLRRGPVSGSDNRVERSWVDNRPRCVIREAVIMLPPGLPALHAAASRNLARVVEVRRRERGRLAHSSQPQLRSDQQSQPSYSDDQISLAHSPTWSHRARSPGMPAAAPARLPPHRPTAPHCLQPKYCEKKHFNASVVIAGPRRRRRELGGTFVDVGDFHGEPQGGRRTACTRPSAA